MITEFNEDLQRIKEIGINGNRETRENIKKQKENKENFAQNLIDNLK